MSETFTNKTIQFDLVSPERILVSEQVAMVIVPGGAGDFGVLADHAPLLSSVRPGVVSVYAPSGEIRKIFVTGGFADVNGKVCSVLAEEAVNVNEIDRAKESEKLKSLEGGLAEAGDDAAKKASLQRDIDITRARLTAVQ